MANIKLQLKAKHFEGTEFYSNKCAISKAYEGLTGIEPFVSLSYIMGKTTYIFDWYGSDKFESDKLKAEPHNWDDTVIRTIELIEG